MSTAVSWIGATGAICATVGFGVVVACGSAGPVGETVASTRQAIEPTTYDVPDPLGNTTVDGQPKKPPPGATPTYPTDPEFCFIMRITGPFTNQGDLSHHQDDNWAEIADLGDHFSFRVHSTLPNKIHMKVGCVGFSAFLHAGNATTEGFTGPYDTQKTGAGFGAHDYVPKTDESTPSFCTLSRVWGNFHRSESNCTGVTYASSINDDAANRTTDVADDGTNGQSCAQVGNPPFWGHYAHYGTVDMSGMCNTKWSGMPGAGLIQFGPVNIRSKTTGELLMKKSDGVCWISGIDGSVDVPAGGTWDQPPFANAAETAEIVAVQNGGDTWWAIQSSTDASATASCIKLDQAQ